MTELVLDASALMAMLREEPGAKKVADAIADACMDVFNYAEGAESGGSRRIIIGRKVQKSAVHPRSDRDGAATA